MFANIPIFIVCIHKYLICCTHTTVAHASTPAWWPKDVELGSKHPWSGRGGEYKCWTCISYWKFEIWGDFQLHPATICSIFLLQDLDIPCALERRGSRFKSSSIIAPNPLVNGDEIPSPTGIMMYHSRHSLVELLVDGCFLFRSSSRCRIGEKYGCQQWYMENIQLGLEQAKAQIHRNRFELRIILRDSHAWKHDFNLNGFHVSSLMSNGESSSPNSTNSI